MKRSGSSFPVLALVLIVAGIAAAAYGYYEYQAATRSLGGAISKVFTGKNQEETTAVLFMIGGGAAFLIGAAMALVRRRR